jgi:hypothetical protein
MSIGREGVHSFFASMEPFYLFLYYDTPFFPSGYR